MEQYLKQLIAQIREAAFNIRPPHNLWNKADLNSEVELEDLAYIEKYYEGKEEPIEDITKIKQLSLPPVEKLSIEQQSMLAIELERLLQHHNFYLEFPKDLPAHLKYPVIFNFWKEKHVAVSFGENCIELCEMEKDICPFPGYCKTCDEVAAQMRYDEEIEERYRQENGDVPDDADFPGPFEETHEDEFYFEEINGFYNDDGEKINPESVPVPGLCIICKQYQSEDWEDNLLCLMNRYDQQNDAKFICRAFEKI